MSNSDNPSFESLARNIIAAVDKIRQEMYTRDFSEHDLREPLSEIESHFGSLLAQAENADWQESADV